ncbi:MAG: hypothetical protein ACK47B_12055 [Armatimonadota bacterium]
MRRRHAGLLAALGVLALGLAARADEQAEALKARALAAAEKIQTLRGEMKITRGGGGREFEYRVKGVIQRPNLARYTVLFEGAPVQTVVSDGKQLLRLMTSQKQFLESAADPQGRNVGFGGTFMPMHAFLNLKAELEAGTLSYGGRKEVDGRTYEVLQLRAERAPQERSFFFDEAGVLRGVELLFRTGDQMLRNSGWLTEVRLNEPAKPEELVREIPEGYQKYVIAQPVAPDYTAELIPVGKEAPRFQLPQPGGGQLSLESALKEKKAVLINFWFYG